MTIIISSILLVLSILFYLFPPKRINSFYGYRTPKSKKSKAHWQYANTMSSSFFLYFSIFNIIMALLIELVFRFDFSIGFSILFIAEMIFMFLFIERKLENIEKKLNH